MAASLPGLERKWSGKEMRLLAFLPLHWGLQARVTFPAHWCHELGLMAEAPLEEGVAASLATSLAATAEECRGCTGAASAEHGGKLH